MTEPFRLKDPRHLTTGAAAFVAALVVALVGIYAKVGTEVEALSG